MIRCSFYIRWRKSTEEEALDIQRIVSELKKERDHLDRVIALLAKTGEGGNPSVGSRSRATKRAATKKHRLTPQGRKRLSDLMKKRWAERRKKNASSRKQAPKAA
jgi:Spy/CpxP family protein refolding chaperone